MKLEHCYMCEHRADIGQGGFYCNLDEKTHCLLGADFPTDCPLQKGGQMKPVKGKWTWDNEYEAWVVYTDGVDRNDADVTRLCQDETPVLIYPDPGLEPDEMSAIKRAVEDYRASNHTSIIDNALTKLALMAGVIE